MTRRSGADHTRHDIDRFTSALYCTEWDIRLIHEDGSHPLLRSPSRIELVAPPYIAFLRAKNAEGYNVIGRPVTTRLMLIDDLNKEALAMMQCNGLVPVAIIETSPGNFQAWIELSPRRGTAPDEALATECARIAARRYGGDMGAARAMQLGRLPGLRNKKTKHRDASGGSPLVRVGHLETRLQPISRGAELLIQEAARNLTTSQAKPKARAAPCALQSSATALAYDMTLHEAAAIYASAHETVLAKRYAADPTDRSRVDFAIAVHLIRSFGFEPRYVAAVIFHGSPKAAERVEDARWNYAFTTAVRAAGMN